MIGKTERAALNDDELTALLLVVHEKEQDAMFAPSDDEEANDPAGELQVFWTHIGHQLEALRHYSVCCACLALVHKDDRDIHPCGPCDCDQPSTRPDAAREVESE